MNNKDKKLIITVGIIAASVLLLVILLFGTKAYSSHKMQKTAEKYVEMKNYEEAISTYNKLIVKSNNNKYIERLDYIKKLDESNKNFIDGEKSFKKEKYKEALNYFKEVIKEDKENYEAAQKMTEDMEEKYVSAIESSIEDMNIEDAEKKIGEYKELFDDSDKILGLKDKLDLAKTKQEKETKEKEELALAKDELEKLKKEAQTVTSRKSASQAGNFGTFHVTSAKANVRTSPSTGGSIITNVSQGSSVYIYETVQDVGRIWCHGIITSSVTGNSYDGWISSRNLDYSL